MFIIVIKITGQYIGPFPSEKIANDWALENIDARTFPWRVSRLISSISAVDIASI